MGAAFAMCLLGPLVVGWDETVATHYGITLRADAWGHAGTLGLVLMAVVGFLFVTLAVAGGNSEGRMKINATGLWMGLLFLALETYTFSRPRWAHASGQVVLTGALLFLVALVATVGISRAQAVPE